MERRIGDIEYEQMLLSRYITAQHRADGGIDRSAYLLLSRIDAHGPMTIAEMSETFRLDASTLQRQTSAAVQAGLLERITDPDGGVAKRFALTGIGETRLTESRERSVRALEQILGDWDTADVNRFADLLQRFNIAIDDYTQSSKGPRIERISPTAR